MNLETDHTFAEPLDRYQLPEEWNGVFQQMPSELKYQYMSISVDRSINLSIDAIALDKNQIQPAVLEEIKKHLDEVSERYPNAKVFVGLEVSGAGFRTVYVSKGNGEFSIALVPNIEVEVLALRSPKGHAISAPSLPNFMRSHTPSPGPWNDLHTELLNSIKRTVKSNPSCFKSVPGRLEPLN